METNTESTRERRGNSLFGPLLLVGAGILLLLNNMGIVDLNPFELLFRYWPLLLVAAGVDILLGRRNSLGVWIGLIVLLFVFSNFWRGGNWWGSAGGGETVAIAQPLAEVSKGAISISAGAGEMRITGSPDPEELVTGTVEPLANEQIRQEYKRSGDTGIYTLQSKGMSSFGFLSFGKRSHGVWNLQLNQAVPLELDIQTGVGEATLDLSKLKLDRLKVGIGVGKTTVTLPGQGNFRAKVEGGVGQVIIYVPASLAVRIEANAGIGSVDVSGNFVREGQAYLTPGYDKADGKVELDVNGGIGSIEIHQIEQK